MYVLEKGIHNMRVDRRDPFRGDVKNLQKNRSRELFEEGVGEPYPRQKPQQWIQNQVIDM